MKDVTFNDTQTDCKKIDALVKIATQLLQLYVALLVTRWLLLYKSKHLS